MNFSYGAVTMFSGRLFQTLVITERELSKIIMTTSIDYV